MSGFEIAGVVLGALPLVISAIEHYESSLDRVTVFFKWQDELDKTLRELWIQHSSYEMTLRNILSGIVCDEYLETMMARYDSPLWKDAEVHDELRRKLGAAYNVYDYTIREMAGYMTTLASHLDIDRKKTQSASDLEAILLAYRPAPSPQGHPKFEFRRRVKFTIKRERIRHLLFQVKECNDRLDSFIEKADRLDQTNHCRAPDQRWKPCLGIPLHQIHSHAIRLHQVLSSALTCRAHPTHRVHLLLEHRMASKKRKGARRIGAAKSQEDYARFTLSFKGALTWRIAEIKILEEPMLPTNTGIRFQVLPPPGPMSAPPNLNTQALSDRLEIIQDLCSTFQSSSQPFLGFYLDPVSQDPLSQCVLKGTYPAAQRPICRGHDLVTLEQILFPPQTNSWQPLTEEDRYLLAITLAASFVQLHDTPWISKRWSERDVLFCEEVTRTNTVQCKRIDVRHPFVTKTYDLTTNIPSAPVTLSSNWAGGGCSHEDGLNLLALAKMLLQIRSGGRVEPQGVDMGLGGPNEMTELQTLKRWVLQEKGNLSIAFRGAITHCMKCFADPDTDLKDVAFRQSLIDVIVAPLLDELHYLQGPL
ncbi:hypothetical protein QBC47DRAFT_118880 [Echria macrotheca]|uniref:DUF7580 domain-containing protein n=1 Tax=Echria macrotheca TaxID=438768 RepID=A0AAJ0B4B6_9PEZI|nr:hypothetical protein QBC47DRAFT_118880 [Echria macrotheca]